MGIQLAKAYGAAKVITATSGEANIAFVKSLGADVVVDYKKQEIFDALQNDSVDIVYDNYGAQGTADRAMRTIRTGGTYLVLTGGGKGTISKHPKVGVKQVHFGLMMPSVADLDELRDLFDKGSLNAHAERTFPLEKVRDAFAFDKTGQVVGKIAITA